MSIFQTKSSSPSTESSSIVYSQLRKDAQELSQLSSLGKLKTADDFSAAAKSLQRVQQRLGIIAGWQNTSQLDGSVTSLSILNNRELNQSIDNLKWNLGMLSGRMTETIGSYLYQSAAKQFKSDKEWSNIKSYTEYDAKKACAIIAAATLVIEVQSCVEKGDLRAAKGKLPELKAALDEGRKYLSDDAQKGLIVLGSQLSSALEKGDLAGAKKKAKELEMVAVVGVTPENAQAAAKYASGSQNAAFLGYTFNPENRSFWSDVTVSTGPFVGTIQMFGDAGYYGYQSIWGDQQKLARNLTLTGINLGFGALSAYADYKMAKSIGEGPSSYSIWGLATRMAKKGATKLAEDGAEKLLVKEGAILLTKEQVLSAAKKEAFHFSEEQLDALAKAGFQALKPGGVVKTLTKDELKAGFKNGAYTLMDDIAEDGYLAVGKISSKPISDGLKALDKMALAELAGVANIKVINKKGVVDFSKDAISKLMSSDSPQLTREMLDELSKYGILRVSESEAADLGKIGVAKAREMFWQAVEKLQKIKSLEASIPKAVATAGAVKTATTGVKSTIKKTGKFVADRYNLVSTGNAFNESALGGTANAFDKAVDAVANRHSAIGGVILEEGLALSTSILYGAGWLGAKSVQYGLQSNVVRLGSRFTLEGYGKNKLERDWIISKTDEGTANPKQGANSEGKTQFDFGDILNMKNMKQFEGREPAAIDILNGGTKKDFPLNDKFVEKVLFYTDGKGGHLGAAKYVIGQLYSMGMDNLGVNPDAPTLNDTQRQQILNWLKSL